MTIIRARGRSSSTEPSAEREEGTRLVEGEASWTKASEAATHEPFLPIPLVACLLIGVWAVFLGVSANQNTKFIRLKAQTGCLTSWKDIGTPVPGETKCCTRRRYGEALFLPEAELRSHHAAAGGGEERGGAGRQGGTGTWDSVCASSYRMEGLLSTAWGAWVLPLAPLLVTKLSQTYLNSVAAQGRGARGDRNPSAGAGACWSPDRRQGGPLHGGGRRDSRQGLGVGWWPSSNSPNSLGRAWGRAGGGAGGGAEGRAGRRWGESCGVRLVGYLGLMLFRTFVLYYALNHLEALVLAHWQHTGTADHDAVGGSPATTTSAFGARLWGGGGGGGGGGGSGEAAGCDYAHLRRSGKCKEAWNASDHVVLLLVHHITVAGSELAILLNQSASSSGGARGGGSVTVGSSPGKAGGHGGLAVEGASAAFAAASLPPSPPLAPQREGAGAGGTGREEEDEKEKRGGYELEYEDFFATRGGGGPGDGSAAAFGGAFRELGGPHGVLSALIAVVTTFSAAYCIRQTAAFFHVPSESVAGLVLSLVSVGGWRALLVARERRL